MPCLPLNMMILGGGGFKDFFLLSSLCGEDSQFDEHDFSNGLKPPTSIINIYDGI